MDTKHAPVHPEAPLFNVDDPLVIDAFNGSDGIFDTMFNAMDRSFYNFQLLIEFAALHSCSAGKVSISEDSDELWPALKFNTAEDKILFMLTFS